MSQQQCLPLPQRRKTDDNSDESGSQTSNLSTMDAMAYLASVNREASLLPDVFVAPSTGGTLRQYNAQDDLEEPIDGLGAASNYLLSSKMNIRPAPTLKHLPRYTTTKVDDYFLTIDEWINSTLSNFSSLRVYINQCRASGLGGKSKSFSRIPVPMSKDRVGWHTFCLGRDEASGNVGGYFQDDSDDNINDDNNDNRQNNEIFDIDDDSKADTIKDKSNTKEMPIENEWDITTVPSTGHKPRTALLCQLDQVIVRRVLSHHVYYLSENWEFTESRGRWIFALLSRLEKPLHWDETSMLRRLLRNLCQLREDIDLSKYESVKEVSRQKRLLSIINVLIVIIGVYFEQGGGADNLMTVQKEH